MNYKQYVIAAALFLVCGGAGFFVTNMLKNNKQVAKIDPTPPVPVKPEPTPVPQPIDPTPAPQPVNPTPVPQPVDPKPTPKPVDPKPAPKPVDPTPAPKPVDPTPAPKPVDPTPAPKPVVDKITKSSFESLLNNTNDLTLDSKVSSNLKISVTKMRGDESKPVTITDVREKINFTWKRVRVNSLSYDAEGRVTAVSISPVY